MCLCSRKGLVCGFLCSYVVVWILVRNASPGAGWKVWLIRRRACVDFFSPLTFGKFSNKVHGLGLFLVWLLATVSMQWITNAYENGSQDIQFLLELLCLDVFGGFSPFHLNCDIISMKLLMQSPYNSLKICRLHNDAIFIAAIGNLCLLFCLINPARDCSVLLIFTKYWLLVSLIFPFLSFFCDIDSHFYLYFLYFWAFFVILFYLPKVKM